jgi:hypothetical protein
LSAVGIKKPIEEKQKLIGLGVKINNPKILKN